MWAFASSIPVAGHVENDPQTTSWTTEAMCCGKPFWWMLWIVQMIQVVWHSKGLKHWLVVWNMNFIFPYIGNNHPNWLSYFSEGLKPPTRTHLVNPGKMLWKICEKCEARKHFSELDSENSYEMTKKKSCYWEGRVKRTAEGAICESTSMNLWDVRHA